MNRGWSPAVVLGWEIRRLGSVVLAFWIALGALVAGMSAALPGAVGFLDELHLVFSVLVALFLGSLWAGSGIEEGNLEFLLVRNLRRTTIFALTHAAGAGLAAAYALLPILAGLEVRWGPGEVAAIAAAYFVASGAAGLLDRSAPAFPIAAAAIGALGGASLYLETRLRFLSFDPAAILLGAAAAGGLVVGWAAVQCHRDPERRRRLLAVLAASGAVALAVAFAIFFDRGTMTPDEAAERFAGRAPWMYEDPLLAGFERPLAVPALRRTLAGSPPADGRELAVRWALHQFGEADATRWFAEEWIRRDRGGAWLRPSDLVVLADLGPGQLDADARAAVLSMGRRMADASRPAGEGSYEPWLGGVVREMARLDRDATWEAWGPAVDAAIAEALWDEALAIVVAGAGYDEHPLDFGGSIRDESVARLLAAGRAARADRDAWDWSLMHLLALARRPETVREACALWIAGEFHPGFVSSVFPEATWPTAIECFSAEPDAAGPRKATLWLLLAAGDRRGLERLRAEMGSFRSDDRADLVQLGRREVWEVLSDVDPDGPAGEAAGALLGRPGAAGRFARRFAGEGTLAAWLDLAEPADWVCHDLLRYVVERGTDPALGAVAARVAAGLPIRYRLPLLAALARGGHPAGLAGLVDALDGLVTEVEGRSSIRFAARVLAGCAGEDHGTDAAAWRRWLGSRG